MIYAAKKFITIFDDKLGDVFRRIGRYDQEIFNFGWHLENGDLNDRSAMYNTNFDLRWFILFFATSETIILVSQLLHAVTY